MIEPRRIPALFLVLWAFSQSLPTVRSEIRIEENRLGNLFLTNETIQIPLSSDGTEIGWKVTDYFGHLVAQGRERLSNNHAVIQPDISQVGYFDLQLTEHEGSEVTSSLSTSFAILTPVDIRTMAHSPFGVMTHFAQDNNPEGMALLARAGIAHFRDEQYWNAIESELNVYRYPQKFTAYMNAAAENALQPLIVLDWSNRHYDYEGGDFTLPHSDFGRDGYVNYVRNVLERYNGQIPFVEVWNEVNAGTFVAGPATTDKPGYYSLLLRETYRAIKSTHPAVEIIAGATVPIAHGFFKSLFEKESLPYLDAVSIHPYLNFPDSVALEISELRELIKLYNDGQTKPIWVTEFSLDASSEADRDTAASHLAQIASLMLSEQVERMYYYLMTDDASFPFRGLFGDASDVRGAFRPHPALVAYATLIRQLGGAVFQHRFSTSPSTYALSFERGEEQVSVLWSNHPLTVSLASSSALVITDMMGGTSRKSPQDGSVSVELSKNVQYVIGPITSVTEVDNDLLADSVSGYSKNVGENGWYYGYAKVGSNQTYRPSKFKEMTWGIWGSDNYRWLGNDEYLFASGSQMHPSEKWAIRRWVSNVAAKVTLFGLISRGEGGDGVNIRIFLDGNEIYNRDLLAGESISYTIPKVKVKIGSKVDFVLNPRSDNSFDATTFTSTIMRYSKSSSAAGSLKKVTPEKFKIAASD